MITKQTKFLDFLATPDARMIVPVFQRVYSWTTRQQSVLWNDIMRAAANGKEHFLGTVYYTAEKGEGGMTQFDLIDGQQRTATFTLLFAALRDHLAASGQTAGGLDANAINTRFLVVDKADDCICKLALSRADAATMAHVVCKAPLPDDEEDRSQYVLDAYEWFTSQMQDDDFDLEAFWRGLGLLDVIAVEIEAHDKAQAIFESLNSKGMSLATIDLMRNYLLMGYDEDEKRRLNREYWEPIERLYANDADDRYLTGAIRWWVAENSGGAAIESNADVYDTFKAHLREVPGVTKEDIMRNLKNRCEWFRSRIDSPRGEEMRQMCDDWATNKAKNLRDHHVKLFGD